MPSFKHLGWLKKDSIMVYYLSASSDFVIFLKNMYFTLVFSATREDMKRNRASNVTIRQHCNRKKAVTCHFLSILCKNYVFNMMYICE